MQTGELRVMCCTRPLYLSYCISDLPDGVILEVDGELGKWYVQTIGTLHANWIDGIVHKLFEACSYVFLRVKCDNRALFCRSVPSSETVELEPLIVFSTNRLSSVEDRFNLKAEPGVCG